MDRYISATKPRKEIILKQIDELYRANYIDLKTADVLAKKYTDTVRLELVR